MDKIYAALISALVAFIIGYIQNRRAASAMREEISHKYNEKLYLKRLETYGELYKILSNLGKQLRKSDLCYQDFHQALELVENWDSKYSVYVSQLTIDKILIFRNIAFQHHKKDYELKPTKDEVEEIFKATLDLEQTLKNELGVYSIDGYHNARTFEESFKYKGK